MTLTAPETSTPLHGSLEGTLVVQTPRMSQPVVRTATRSWERSTRGDSGAIEACRKAASENPRGVRFAYLRPIAGNKSRLAGYLDLDSIADLDNLAHHPFVQQILQLMTQHSAHMNKRIWVQKFADYLEQIERGVQDWDTALSLQGLAFENPTAAMHRITAHLCHEFIKCNPQNIFTGPADHDQPCSIGPHDAEDWFRALSLVRHIWKTHKDEPRLSLLPARQPLYYEDRDKTDDARSPAETQRLVDMLEAQDAQNQAMREIYCQNRDTFLRARASTMLSTLTIDSEEAYCRGVEKLMNSAKHTWFAEHQPLDPERQSAHLKQIYQDLEVTYKAGFDSIGPEPPFSLSDVQPNLRSVLDAMDDGFHMDDLSQPLLEDERTETRAQRASNRILHQAIKAYARIPPLASSIHQLGGGQIVHPNGTTPILSGIRICLDRFPDIELFPWQVTGIHSILLSLNSPLNTAILADATGLGKTLQVLCALVLENERQEQRFSERCRRLKIREGLPGNEMDPDCASLSEKEEYSPTLIVCPRHAIQIWKDEIERCFSKKLEARLLYRNDEEISMKDGRFRHITNGDGLRRALGSPFLHPGNPEAAKCVILTTIDVFRKRTLCTVRVPGESENATSSSSDATNSAYANHGRISRAACQSDDAEEDADPPEAREGPEIFVSLLKGQIRRIVVDEAYKIKNSDTKAHAAVACLEAKKHILVTASPITNRVIDLAGSLEIMWPHVRAVLPEDERTRLLEPDDYAAAGEDFKSSGLHLWDKDAIKYYAYLNPTNFRRAFEGTGSFDCNRAIKMLPIVLMLTTIRRRVGDMISWKNEEILVGREIPPCRIITNEMNMTEQQKDDSAGLIASIDGELNPITPKKTRTQKIARRTATARAPPSTLTGVASSMEKGRRDTDMARRLIQLGLSPQLETYRQRGYNIKAEEIKDMHHECFWTSYLYWWGAVAKDPGMPPHLTREEVAYWLASDSCKLKFFAKVFRHVIHKKKSKLVVFVDWPHSLWLLAKFCEVLSINYRAFRYGTSLEQREQDVNAFNNDDSVQLLIVSSRTQFSSINLQKGAHHMLILDVVSIPMIRQCIGRIHRLGQKYKQTVWLCMANYSFDQFLWQKAMEKYLPELSAIRDFSGINKDDYEAMVQQADRELVEELGLRSSRRDKAWANYRNPMAKDDLPSEAKAIKTGAFPMQLKIAELKHEKQGLEELIRRGDKGAFDRFTAVVQELCVVEEELQRSRDSQQPNHNDESDDSMDDEDYHTSYPQPSAEPNAEPHNDETDDSMDDEDHHTSCAQPSAEPNVEPSAEPSAESTASIERDTEWSDDLAAGFQAPGATINDEEMIDDFEDFGDEGEGLKDDQGASDTGDGDINGTPATAGMGAAGHAEAGSAEESAGLQEDVDMDEA